MVRAAAIAATLLAGCGGDTAAPPDAGTYEPPAFVPGPNVVTLEVDFDVPFYIRYHDGDGPWTEPQPNADGTYDLHITNSYEVVALCGGLSGYDAEMIKRTYDDGPVSSMLCIGSALSARSGVVTVYGTMVQPGAVFFDEYDQSSTGPWSFSLAVAPGTHDLFAVGASNILIARDQEITTSTMLPDIDVVQDGVPLEPRTFAVNAEPGETIRSRFTLETAHGDAVIDGTATQFLRPPSALLQPGDAQRYEVSARTATTDRSVETEALTDANFTLPPVLTGIEYSFPYRQLWATWHDLPAFTELEMTGYGGGFAFSFQSVSVSPSFIEATQARWLSFYPLPPDYDGRFLLDVVGPYVREITAYDSSQADVSRRTTISENRNF